MTELMTENFQGRWVIALKLHIVGVSVAAPVLLSVIGWLCYEAVVTQAFRLSMERSETRRLNNEDKLDELATDVAVIKSDVASIKKSVSK